MSLYFIRHGQTKYNKTGKLTGSVNIPLNAEGKAEAKRISKKLPKSIKEIWCSDLLRAKQTCAIINKELKLPVKYTHNLRGRSFGSLQNKTWLEVAKKYPEKDLRLIDEKQKYNYRPFGGDSVGDVKKRLRTVCKSLRKRKHDILIITSGGVIRLLIYIITNKINLHIPNCDLYKLKIEKDKKL